MKGAALLITAAFILNVAVPPALFAYADDASTPAASTNIQTGDASSEASSDNEINANTTAVPPAASSTVDDTNVASTTATTSATADTGGNTVTQDSSGGSSSITTGNAYASANVLNVLNTNIVNSQGLVELVNELNGDGLNISSSSLSYFLGGSGDTSGCSLASCSGSLTVTNTNDATLNNAVIVRSNTGGNTASSTGDTSVSTGNAYAAANVLNVVNTNVINSNYLLLALNNLGDLNGDITLPSASFFNQLLSGSSGVANTTVSNTNTATVSNDNSATANTGSNTASGNADVVVATGNAYSAASSINQVNTNSTGGSNVYILVNVLGNWLGNVQGLPAGMSWVQTPTGIALTGSSLSSLSGSSAPLVASSTNTASVANDVQVYALTGSNEASSDGSAALSTGDAYAASNVINIVNTTIIGQNWLLAIFNVLGNWTGNLDFGQPDLWIGATADAQNPAPPGSEITYHFTVANNGDADATNVMLNASFDSSLLSFTDPNASSTAAGDAWNLGTIPAGQTEDFSYTAVAEQVGGQVPASLEATVTSDETDANLVDNTENITVMIGVPASDGGGTFIGPYMQAPKLTITKTESASATTSPATVDYKVVVTNDSDAGPAYGALLTDDLTDPLGKKMYHNAWDLDTINPGDKITLTYSIQYDASSTPGVYTDVSTVTGLENYSIMPYANALGPLSATSSLELSGGGQVLGDATDVPSNALACGPFLTSYLSPGGFNDPAQVKLLQYYLDTFEGASVPQSGIYGASTIEAVKAFQQKYASDVLSPWGVSAPSGSVYYLTQEKINNLYCQGRANFSLTAAEQQEVLAYSKIAAQHALAAARKQSPLQAFKTVPIFKVEALKSSQNVATPGKSSPVSYAY